MIIHRKDAKYAKKKIKWLKMKISFYFRFPLRSLRLCGEIYFFKIFGVFSMPSAEANSDAEGTLC